MDGAFPPVGCLLAPPPPARSVRLQFAQQKAEAADLERQLWVAQALLVAARSRIKGFSGATEAFASRKCSEERCALEAELEEQRMHSEALRRSEAAAADEALAAAAESRRLGEEMAEASRQVALLIGGPEGGEVARLRADLASAGAASERLGGELRE
ncbi:unnamed protein product, partial [Polarella glacialis]